MAITLLSPHKQATSGLLAIEWIMVSYCLFTFILAGILWDKIEAAPIINRLLILTSTLVLWKLYRLRPCLLIYLLRILFQVALLGYWYPDIYYFAKFMPNTDHIFAHIDQVIFGCQPAILFRQILSGLWWKELFNLGYFSYYLMIITIFVWPLFHSYKWLDYSTCVMVCSFMLFYVIFLFLQSAGPQFYFQHIGFSLVSEGKFPEIGNWFLYHSELIHDNSSQGGLFSHLVEIMQEKEKPIAAFPSSHVGLSSIIILLFWKMSRRMFWIFFPFYVILCLSTVYIGAHYAIDVLGGWLFAVPIFYLSSFITNKLLKMAH
jgi:membrane-associated phospholipid phosphatase